MYETLQQWIGRNLRQPGIKAFGVRLPDKTCFSHSFAPEFEEKSLDETWHNLIDVANALLLHKIPATRLRWTYGSGYLHFVIRHDGIALGLFSDPSEEASVIEGVERLLEEFMGLDA